MHEVAFCLHIYTAGVDKFTARQSNDAEFSGCIETFRNRNFHTRPPALFHGFGKVISGIEWTASENSFFGFVETLTAAKSQFGSVKNPASKNSLGGHVYRFLLEKFTVLISVPGPLDGMSV